MSEDPAPASTAETAKALRLRADPPRVMQLSRKAMAIAGGVVALGVGGALIFAFRDRSDVGKPPPEIYNTQSRTPTEKITSAPKDYSQIPQLGPPLPGDLGRPIVSAQARGAEVPAPAMGSEDPGALAPTTTPDMPLTRSTAQMERDGARTSAVFFGISAQERSEGSMPADPALALGLEAQTNGLTATPMTGSAATAPGDQAAKRAFLAQGTTTSTTASGRLTAPISPYVIQAGSVIAAALVTGLRSDLPGQITAQVTQDVYDSPTGRFLLIPQGARLIGAYDSEVALGQSRALLVWTRLILPGGRSITLDREPGADARGFAGLQDRVDHHWGAIGKAALLSTLLGIGAELGSGDNDSDLARAIREGAQGTINQAGQQLVRRQMDIQPTLTVRPGHPVRVVVTRDLVLEPLTREPR